MPRRLDGCGGRCAAGDERRRGGAAGSRRASAAPAQEPSRDEDESARGTQRTTRLTAQTTATAAPRLTTGELYSTVCCHFTCIQGLKNGFFVSGWTSAVSSRTSANCKMDTVTKFDQVIFKKIIKIAATRCQILRLKMHQIRFWLGLCPRPRWGSLQHSPRSPSCRCGRGLATPFQEPYPHLSPSGLDTLCLWRLGWLPPVPDYPGCPGFVP